MKIDIVLMASGDSKRFGSENKLFHLIDDKPMILYAIENAVALKKMLPDIIDKVLVVSKFAAVREICSSKCCIYIENTNSDRGISESVHLGVENSGDNSLMFMTCDQPYLRAETLFSFVRGYIASGKDMACLCNSKGEGINPCIFSDAVKRELLKITGDRGGKVLINKYSDKVYFHKVYNDIEVKDIDYRWGFNEK